MNAQLKPHACRTLNQLMHFFISCFRFGVQPKFCCRTGVQRICPTIILLLFIKQNFAKKLVSADRTALFLVENRTKELYARVFDMGEAYDEENPKPPPAQKEIRFETVDKSVAWTTWWSFGVDVSFMSESTTV